MAAGNWTFPNSFRTDVLSAAFNFPSDTFKCALFLSTSNLSATSTVYSGLTNEHANANGYTTGGITVPMTLTGTTSVTLTYVNPVWTATGGSIIARWAVIYKTSTSRIACYCLLDNTPADYTTTAGNTLTVDSDGTPGPILTAA